MRRRHADYFLALAERAEQDLNGPGQGPWMDRLEAEHEDLRAALGWALTQPGPADETALRMAAALGRFWEIRGYLSEGRAWLERALAPGHGSVRGRARALHVAGVLASRQSDWAAAAGLHEESLALLRQLGDARRVAAALLNLGLVAWGQGDLDRAETRYAECLALAREVGANGAVAASLNNLGLLAYDRGDSGRAVALYSESLELARVKGDLAEIGGSLQNLGDAVRDLGDHRRAAALYAEALGLHRELGDKLGVATTLEGAAGLAVAVGQAARAVRLLGAAEALRDAIGAPLRLGEADHVLRDRETARTRLDATGFDLAWAAGRALSSDEAVVEVGAVAADLAIGSAAGADPPAATADDGVDLTPREREVLRLLVDGLTDKEIGTALNVSPRTASNHVAHILRKLGVERRAAAAGRAVQDGLV